MGPAMSVEYIVRECMYQVSVTTSLLSCYELLGMPAPSVQLRPDICFESRDRFWSTSICHVSVVTDCYATSVEVCAESVKVGRCPMSVQLVSHRQRRKTV